LYKKNHGKQLAFLQIDFLKKKKNIGKILAERQKTADY